MGEQLRTVTQEKQTCAVCQQVGSARAGGTSTGECETRAAEEVVNARVQQGCGKYNCARVTGYDRKPCCQVKRNMPPM